MVQFFSKNDRIMKIDNSPLGAGVLSKRDILPKESDQQKNLQENRLKTFGLTRAKDFKVVGKSSISAGKKGLEIAKQKREESKQKKSETIQANQTALENIMIEKNLSPKDRFIKLRSFAKQHKKELTGVQRNRINNDLRHLDKENNLIANFVKSKSVVSANTSETKIVPTTQAPETESVVSTEPERKTFEELDATTQEEVLEKETGLTKEEFDKFPSDLKAQIRATKVIS